MELRIGTVDTALLVTYLLAMVGFGFWMGRGQRDLADYAVGGRNLPWWALLISIVATETSTATFLSVPGIAFAPGGNLTFLQVAIGYVLGRYVVAWILLPLYASGKLLTSYQVLQERVGPGAQWCASGLFLITRTLADGLRLYLAAVALEAATGLPTNGAILVMGVATILYTFVGGIRAVVWTDFIQFVVYIAGALIAGGIILSSLEAAGVSFVAFAESEQKFRLFRAAPDGFAWTWEGIGLFLSSPYTVLGGVLGGLFVTLGTHGTDQLTVQRLLCARSHRESWWALTLSGWLVLAQFALFLLLGIGLAAFYAHTPDAQHFEKPDEVFATFVVEQLPVGVVGITLAAVFSAAMSTLSSSLNSSATALVGDFLGPAWPRASDRLRLNLTRLATVGFGILQVAVAVAAQSWDGSVVVGALTIQSFTTGIILGVFFLALLSVGKRPQAVLVGLVVGLGCVAVLAFGTSLAWTWYALVGSGITVTIGLIASSLFGVLDSRSGSRS